jgi:ATP-binding cassette subfamily C (CFTR/MRP) protein 1
LRFNLDPFDQCNSLDIENVLRKVGLWQKIISADLKSEFDPNTFSSGERQLLSLARAVLQCNAQRAALVLMDEATSSLDEETEDLVNKTLVDEFEGCTLISVAHRPSSIRMADLIVSMEGGKIVEVGRPRNFDFAGIK